MAVVEARPALGVRSAVHVDGAIGVWPADVEDVDALQLRHLDALDSVSRLERARDARSLAAGMRFKLVELAIGVERRRPRLERDVRRRRERCGDADGRKPEPLVFEATASETDATVGKSRGW